MITRNSEPPIVPPIADPVLTPVVPAWKTKSIEQSVEGNLGKKTFAISSTGFIPYAELLHSKYLFFLPTLDPRTEENRIYL